MRLVDDRPEVLTVVEACASVELPRATYYRARSSPTMSGSRPSPRRLSDAERQRVLEVLISERFRDQPVRQVWAQLLDDGTYLCSVRTMYRILAENQAVRERRDQLRHPEYSRPELLATGSNQLWSWDITKLKGPHVWNCFHLYVVMDVYSRKVVGWLVAGRESATLAVELIRQSCQREGIRRDQLTVHADRGSSMPPDQVRGGGVFAGRPGRDQDPLAAVHEHGQSVLGGTVQDLEVPAGLSGAVRFDRRCAGLPGALLRLVQQ